MIPVRHYDATDAIQLDTILRREGDVRLDRDRIVVAGDRGDPVGCLAWRPGGIVHELRVPATLGRHHTAANLVDFAITHALSRPFLLYEAIFVTDNNDVAEFVRSLGADEQEGKRLFTLQIR